MKSAAQTGSSLALAAVAAVLTVLSGCGEGGRKDAGDSTAATITSTSTTTSSPASPARRPAPHHESRQRSRGRKPAPARHPKPKPPPVPPGVSRALHAYVAALDARDGQALCSLFEPGTLDVLRLPKGSGCDGLSASIGYGPPHGLPQWSHAEVAGVKSVVRQGQGVRATVTIVDRYHANPQASIEDDVVFLARSGDRWLIEKPSVTIYRAIGVPSPPPSVLAAP